MDTSGERIKKIREERGWSQTELASMLGHDNYQYISKLETGRSKATYEKLLKIADVLDTSVNYLLCETDDPRRSHAEDVYFEVRDQLFTNIITNPGSEYNKTPQYTITDEQKNIMDLTFKLFKLTDDNDPDQYALRSYLEYLISKKTKE